MGTVEAVLKTTLQEGSVSRRLGQEEILPPLHFHPMTGAEQGSLLRVGPADCTQTIEQAAGPDECTARGSGHSAVEFSSLCRPPPPGSGSKCGDFMGTALRVSNQTSR